MKYVNVDALNVALKGFKGAKPFDHCVVDGFFKPEVLDALVSEFPDYESDCWFVYRNAIENKKALNDWNAFPSATYRVLAELNSPEFVRSLAEVVGCDLFSDSGLHGGGWHIHGDGGNLNPHLDYSIHPKVGLERKINIIIYMAPGLDGACGGDLGLWESAPDGSGPAALAKEIAPVFNRAVIFDTTQNSWHGMSRGFSAPAGVYRKSLAVYYLREPAEGTDPRGRALFAPNDHQVGDGAVLELIRSRSDVSRSADVYVRPPEK